jgi:predicted lipid-binding transport protein (Tim44 family)
VSRNFKLYYPYIIALIGFVLFVNYGLTNAQTNLSTNYNLSPNAQPNASTTNAQPNASTTNAQPNASTTNAQPNASTTNAQPNAATKDTSSSITETVNQVLSGSIDGMIGDTVDMLTSDTANMGKDSAKSSFENKLPSSLNLGKNNNSIAEDSPTNERIQGNSTNNTLNTNKQIIANNESTSDPVGEIKQSFQKSMYNSTIVQSFDNNSFSKLGNQNIFDDFVFKMKNILDINLFK